MDSQSQLLKELQTNGNYLSSLLTSIQLKIDHPDLPSLNTKQNEEMKKFLEQQQGFNTKLIRILQQ